MRDCWPFGVALRGEASNRHMLRERWRDRGERCGKGTRDVSGGDREGERERIAVDVSKTTQVTPKPGCTHDPGMSLARARSAASGRNRRRPESTLPVRFLRVGERE